VAIPINGIAAALPIIGIRALVQRLFFSNLSAMIPPRIPEVRPRTERTIELTNEY
jgi:hypothetical protein